MSCNSIATEVNKALKKNSLNNDDVFAVVANDTLYGVTFASVIAQMGFTGSIDSVGNGTQVITGLAPDYFIRSLAAGNGVTIQVDPQQNIRISASLSNAGNTSSGAALIQATNTQQIPLRRIRAGNGIRVTQETNSILIENSEVAVSNDTTIVSELSDFPDPVGGVITLQDNRDYLLVSDISTSNRFVFGENTVVRAVDARITIFTYTGADVMFTFPNGNQSVSNITLSCPNGTLFDTTGNTVGNLLMRWVALGNINNLGVLHKPNVGIYNVFANVISGQGFVFGGAITRLTVGGFTVASITSASHVFMNLDDVVFNSLSIEGVEILASITGSTLISGEPAGANLSAAAIGFVSDINIQGPMALLEGIQYTDVAWDFSRCNKIPTTSPNALAYLSASDTVTINTAGTPEILDGNGNFVEHSAWHLSANLNGRIAYLGKRTAQRDINVELTLAPVSGTNKAISAYIAKNGVPITGSRITSVISSGSSRNISLIWSDLMDTNDFYEIYIANDTDTTNVVASAAIFRID